MSQMYKGLKNTKPGNFCPLSLLMLWLIFSVFLNSPNINAYPTQAINVANSVIFSAVFAEINIFMVISIILILAVVVLIGFFFHQRTLSKALEQKNKELDIQIKEREKAEAARAQEQQLLKTLVDNLPDFICIKDTQGRFIFSNSAHSWFLGCNSSDSLIGKKITDFIPMEYASVFENDDKQVLQTGQPLICQERLAIDNLGQKRWLSWTVIAIKNEKQQIDSLLCVGQDITARKKADDALRESEKRYRTLIATLPQRIFYKDVNSVFISVNPAFAADLNLTPQEIVGKTDFDFFPKELAEKYIADDRRIILQKKTETIEEINISCGKKRIVEVVKTPVIEEDGTVSGILGIFTDITERKIAEAKLRAFTTKLEKSNRELQDFAYIASHDLQEPLRKIVVFGERLRNRCIDKLTDDEKFYLDRMHEAGRRMQTLINDLLTFSRVTTQAHPFVPINLKNVIREVLIDLEMRIEQTKGKIEVGDMPVIEADQLQIRQLFQNLIGNSLKFHKLDVPPVINITSRILSSAQLNKPGDTDWCEIIVKDNGIGFDPKYAERVFQMFFRLHNRTTYEGTGMGLAICKKIVERHNGEISAESTPGVGTTFRILLPVKQERDEGENTQ
jgi:PAS domain S-box-containing protein